MADQWRNQLYFGDNLQILRDHILDESIDLIYLDPPFNSQATYHVPFKERSRTQSAAQITAFDDTWHWGLEAENTYRDLVTLASRQVADLIQAFRAFLGATDMLAYLVMMAVRLVELHRVLKPTGSIYLHCDPTASHFLKLLMDSVFTPQMFINEIVWKRSQTRSSISRIYRRAHDVILFYAKTNKYKYSLQYRSLSEMSHKLYSFSDAHGPYQLVPLLVSGRRKGATGEPWRGIDPNTRGRAGMHWITTPDKLNQYEKEGRVFWPNKKGGLPRLKYYLNDTKGVPLSDFWEDVPIIASSSSEALPYPTQKPEALLGRIIKGSSEEGQLVLDPFCGCGTTLAVAERLKRRWIGIDITHLAITLMKKRLHDTFGPELSLYQEIGVPEDYSSAEALARLNRHQFEWWAVGLVEARPAQDKRKGPDTGIDGYINFFDDNSGQAKKIIVQVKSGTVSVAQIRDLKGVLEREQAVIGVFITLREPTAPMKKEAAQAGFYEPEHFPGQRYPRLQIFTITELLGGAQVLFPRVAPTATFKKAERQRKGPAAEELQNTVAWEESE